MPVFITSHQAPGISREEIAAYAPDVADGVHATFQQMFAHSASGYIVSVYDAESSTHLQQEFERIGFPYVAIHEIDVVLDVEALRALAAR